MFSESHSAVSIRIRRDASGGTLKSMKAKLGPSTSLTVSTISGSSHTERTVHPLRESFKYLGVIFSKRITWRLHIEIIEAKAFRTFIRVFSLLKSERLGENIKLTLHKALTIDQ
jgi:hypothetical protein